MQSAVVAKPTIVFPLRNVAAVRQVFVIEPTP